MRGDLNEAQRLSKISLKYNVIGIIAGPAILVTSTITVVVEFTTKLTASTTS